MFKYLKSNFTTHRTRLVYTRDLFCFQLYMDLSAATLKFLCKYFLVLKAASDGWIVKYVGGDVFEFYKSYTKTDVMSPTRFLEVYQCKDI